MAIISGVTVRWGLSPRLIVIPVAETEVTLEDLQDTLQDIEDDPQGMPFNKLRSMTGGQELDASTNVGFTMQLNNAQLIWETYVSVLDSGTITTPDTDGLSLIDSTGLFVTNGVEAGDMVVNSTDGSHATILSVVSETEVLVDVLVGGIDNQFDSADSYTIFDWQLRALTGGNLVAANSSGTSISPVLNSFGNSFDRTSSSSATVSELGDIRHASFDNGVHVDVTSSTSGSAYPAFNSANPGNNWADAAVVNAREGFDHYFVEKSATLDSAVDFTDAAFTGKSIIDTVLSVPSGTTVDKAEFTNLSLEGSLGETTIMQACFLGETNPLLDVRGVVEDCSIGPSPLTLGGTSAQTVRFVRCNGAGEDTSPATVNGGGDGPKFDVQDYTGALKIANKTGSAFWDIHVTGELIIDSTCIAGVIRATGAGNLTDESGSGCTVIDEMLKPVQVSEMWRLQGLEFGNPMTVTTTARSVADQSISLALTGDGVTTTTVTRQTDQTVVFDAPLTADLLDDSDTGATPTFTRASTATYLDGVTGLITSAAIDAPRFELGGLLIEGERTNILLQSEDFSTIWTENNAASTFNQATAPDGTLTADKLLDNSATGTGEVYFQQGGDELFIWKGAVEPAESAASGNEVQLWKGAVEPAEPATAATQTYSIFAKADQLSLLAMRVISPVSAGAWFDLSAGTVGTVDVGFDDSGIEDSGNGWYRCWVSFTTDNPNNLGKVRAYAAQTDASYVSDLDGTSSIFVWGGQVEAGDVSSYIPTTTTSVTRSADFLTYNDDMIVDSLGCMIASITPNSAAIKDAVIANIADQLVGPLYMLDDTTQKAAIGDGTTVNSVALTPVSKVESKIASRWSTADDEIETIADGTAAGVSAYDDVFTRVAGTLYIGSDSTGNHINGNIKNVKIYNVDRGTAQLQVDTG